MVSDGSRNADNIRERDLSGRSIVEIRALLPGDSPRFSPEDEEHVRRLFETEDKLPPIVVHQQTMRVIDGAHRLRAAQLRGETLIEVEFFAGTEEEAFIRAVELNTAHGLPLTLAERKAAAARIIAARPERSDRAVARSAGLSDKTVAAIRRMSAENPQAGARRGLDGRLYRIDNGEGRLRAAEVVAQQPSATLRQIARAAGISVSTAKDVRDRIRRGDDPLLPAQERRRKGTSSAPPPREFPGADAAEMQDILQRLQRDPSLRFSQTGRELLRLLQEQCLTLEKLSYLVENVPSHCTETVIKFSRIYAAQWNGLGRVLGGRIENSGIARPRTGTDVVSISPF